MASRRGNFNTRRGVATAKLSHAIRSELSDASVSDSDCDEYDGAVAMQDNIDDDSADDSCDDGRADESSDNESVSDEMPAVRSRKSYVWVDVTRPSVYDAFEGPRRGVTQAAIDEVNDRESDPIAYFELIFKEDFYDHLAKQTNLYFKQTRDIRDAAGNPKSPNSRALSWRDITTNDIKKYLGLTMLMSINSKRGAIEEYWSTDEALEMPFFPKMMSRVRFQLIKFHIHFNDEKAMPDDCSDRLYKVRPLFDYFIEKWQKYYHLGENLSIDEGMLKWRGRLSFRTYNKNKPIKYGIKSYILADSSSKYCYNIDTYCAEKKTLKQTVWRLLSPNCFGKWHKLYMDNLYNSTELSEILLEKKVHTVGTLRTRRGQPQEIDKPTSMVKGDLIVKDNGKVFVYAWKDKRVVKAISTMHSGSQFVDVQRWVKTDKKSKLETVKKPKVIFDYNKNMSGCDGLDQSIAYYPTTRKTSQWTTKLFFYLVDISIHNCYVLYKSASPNNKMSLRSFRIAVIKYLCGPSDSLERDSPQSTEGLTNPPMKRSRHDPSSRLKGGFDKHILCSIPGENKPVRKCSVCREKRTRYQCANCNKALCVVKCFNLYHTKKYVPKK